MRFLTATSYSSDLAGHYQKRFLRNREKLFTFIEYDGVPWNNNNAEHAVKTFANYRDIADGKMTEAGIDDYLVLLSIYQTCRYKGTSFLKFLISQNKDVAGFLLLHQRRPIRIYRRRICVWLSKTLPEGK